MNSMFLGLYAGMVAEALLDSVAYLLIILSQIMYVLPIEDANFFSLLVWDWSQSKLTIVDGSHEITKKVMSGPKLCLLYL